MEARSPEDRSVAASPTEDRSREASRNEAAPAEVGHASGEHLRVPERVIIAPTAGRFQPVPDEAGDSGDISEEQVIGFVEGHGQSIPVRSPFRGLFMGLLAHAGERVREGQPVAWMRQA